MKMKTVHCSKCKTPFYVPYNCPEHIICEQCDPQMNPPKKPLQPLTYILIGMAIELLVITFFRLL